MLTLWIYSKFTCLSNLEIHNAIYISDAFLISHGKKRYFGLSWMQHFGNAPLLQFLSPFENLSSSRFQNGKAGIHFTFCSCLVGAVRREIYQPQVIQIAFMSKHFCALGLFQNNFFLCKLCRKRCLATREIVPKHLPNCVALKNLGKPTCKEMQTILWCRLETRKINNMWILCF